MATYDLPDGISSKVLRVLDLDMHVLEALPPSSSAFASQYKPPLLLLLHGFPELAYSWRKVMVPLAQRGYRVIAPEQRGYGRTLIAGEDQQDDQRIDYDEDLSPYTQSRLAKDIIALISVLGYDAASSGTDAESPVVSIVGHDFGSMVAGWCVLLKPELFAKGGVVFMSLPFTGAGGALTTGSSSSGKTPVQALNGALSMLNPPRKHYSIYLSSPQANSELLSGFSDETLQSNPIFNSLPTQPYQSLHAFLRVFYHTKSGDWSSGTDPHPLLDAETAQAMQSLVSAPPQTQLKVLQAFASLPHYYVMPLNSSMPQAVLSYALAHNDLQLSNNWLSDDELAVYVSEFSRRGF
ncbi:hypothetical protein CVT24_006002 [Panaeolus cyanescens]|uniref:AB hydrolase-1 domain-containing protein n=1 Tax=Panaeolus cyanescens TaxID=181874 RepID=A0A409YE16_9AGAR|nr:hypothetical protein CVT24_006002 [Panaeolus cyanescens]